MEHFDNYEIIARPKNGGKWSWKELVDPIQGPLIYDDQTAVIERVTQLRAENEEWEYVALSTNGEATMTKDHQNVNPWYAVVQEMIEYMGLIPGGAYTDPKVALQNMKDRWDYAGGHH